ncbi:hypothetical protein H311_01355 [Anncaliia algerae PRA109]|nr:hypothetical protein H311_01355 [Anncaliia algerae PRA109]
MLNKLLFFTSLWCYNHSLNFFIASTGINKYIRFHCKSRVFIYLYILVDSFPVIVLPVKKLDLHILNIYDGILIVSYFINLKGFFKYKFTTKYV